MPLCCSPTFFGIGLFQNQFWSSLPWSTWWSFEDWSWKHHGLVLATWRGQVCPCSSNVCPTLGSREAVNPRTKSWISTNLSVGVFGKTAGGAQGFGHFDVTSGWTLWFLLSNIADVFETPVLYQEVQFQGPCDWQMFNCSIPVISACAMCHGTQPVPVTAGQNVVGKYCSSSCLQECLEMRRPHNQSVWATWKPSTDDFQHSQFWDINTIHPAVLLIHPAVLLFGNSLASTLNCSIPKLETPSRSPSTSRDFS